MEDISFPVTSPVERSEKEIIENMLKALEGNRSGTVQMCIQTLISKHSDEFVKFYQNDLWNLPDIPREKLTRFICQRLAVHNQPLHFARVYSLRERKKQEQPRF